MQQITVICSESFWSCDQGPLIYVINVSNPKDKDEVRRATIEARIADLGEDYREELEQSLDVLFAFDGDLSTIADYRE